MSARPTAADAAPAAPPAGAGRAAVIAVPTFGRRELLWRCLDSVAALDPRPAAVVVVDGNDEPVVPDHRPDWIHVVREPNRGPAHARNVADRAARELAPSASIVCFLDDDAVVPTTWVADHVAAHAAHPDAGAVGGSIENLTGAALASDHLHRTSFAPLRLDPGPVRFVPTVNVSYKTACLDEVGSFDTALVEAAGEDVDHCMRVLAAGWTVWYEPSIVVGHHYPTSVVGLLRKQGAYGRGFVLTRSRHPELPGADFLDLPWWRALLGTVPHLTREGMRAARRLGPAHGPIEVACQAAYRAAALRERRRLERVR